MCELLPSGPSGTTASPVSSSMILPASFCAVFLPPLILPPVLDSRASGSRGAGRQSELLLNRAAAIISDSRRSRTLTWGLPVVQFQASPTVSLVCGGPSWSAYRNRHKYLQKKKKYGSYRYRYATASEEREQPPRHLARSYNTAVRAQPTVKKSAFLEKQIRTRSMKFGS